MTHEEQLTSYRHISIRSKTLVAVRKGILIRPAECSECGANGKVNAHHNDYDDHMNVEWLCHACHWKRHGSVDHLEPDTTPYCHIKVCSNNAEELSMIKEFAKSIGYKKIGELLLEESFKPSKGVENKDIDSVYLDGLSEISTIGELAEYLKVDDDIIKRAIKSGKLKALKVSRDWRIERKAVVEWIKEGDSYGK